MIAVDTNILVYAHRPDSEWHPIAFKLLAELAAATKPWGIPWPCISEFCSTVTNPRIYKPHSTCEEAVFQIECWMEVPTLRLLGESGEYWKAYREIILTGKIHGPAVHDARIAAICATSGVHELWSADRSFSRMRGVRVKNPLIV